MIGNQFWQRFAQLRAVIPIGGGGNAVLRKTETAHIAEYTVRFFLALLLTGAQVFVGLSPFAVGLTAAADSIPASVVTLAGAVVGYLLWGSFYWAIKYISMALLVCAAAVVFRNTNLSRSTWFMPSFTAFIAACISFVTSSTAGWSLVSAGCLLADTTLAGGCAYFYKIALSPWSGRLNFERGAELRHTVGVLILVSTFLLSIAGVKLFGIVSIGRTAAAFIIFLVTYKGGVGIGCASGISIGLAMDAQTGGLPFFSMAYGLAGLIGGIFSKQNKLIYTLSFILAGAVASLFAIDTASVPAVLYEIFIASVIFIILPDSFMSGVAALLPVSGSGNGILKAREYAKNHVDQASLAFRELYETVKTASGEGRNDNDIATVFDKASEDVCRKCAKSAKCWHQDYGTTIDVMNNAAPAMLERGKLEKSDFPDYFSENCLDLTGFIAAANSELRDLLYRRQYRNRLQENRSAAFNQYADISSILSGIAAELGSGTSFDPELETRLQKYLRSLNIQADTAVFRDCGGRLHADISGTNLVPLTKDVNYLDKLSAVLKLRLCTSENAGSSDRIILLEAEPLSATVGISCLKKQDVDISGDRGAYFKTDEGILNVLLSDGMGSGAAAAKYSGETVHILERFLRSGVSAETAMRMLNDLMLLKNEDDTGCATVDLLCINLFSGETHMFKYGAAPSYLKQGGAVRRIKGKSLAAGLGAPPHDAPDHLKMELKAGSLAVIVSDGVTAGLDDAWLQDMIANSSEETPKELAGAILETATARFGSEDDMTVIAVRVEERP